jgi:2-C-methyl-D-erythritol 4-phosphate cytidylyltransferase/2-C-methyl-D-erythritol 2,4-cyclodiphosphate synthase
MRRDMIQPNSSARHDAVIVAAGSGARVGGMVPKQYLLIGGKPMLLHSVEAFLAHDVMAQIWLVIGPGQERFLDFLPTLPSRLSLVTGGVTRQDSVRLGLEAIAALGGSDFVHIHDAARPFFPAELIDRLVAAVDPDNGAVPLLDVTDSLASLNQDGGYLPQDRTLFHRVQTPQSFPFQPILAAHRSKAGDSFSDDASLFVAAGGRVKPVSGDEAARKYTFASDFMSQSDRSMPQIRTGIGYDVHRLGPGEELWLGGLLIAHDRGLIGHSDADVLLHAITDAIFGALSAGDIGDHFPPSDPQWRGKSSAHFLSYAVDMVRDQGGELLHIDATVICEAPKIKPHRAAMRQRVAEICSLPIERISIKATTTEGLGFTGRQEGIAAQAVATIRAG